MPLKRFKPYTPSRRHIVSDFSELTDKSEKTLLQPKKRISGRNNMGRNTMRRRGGESKRLYRIVDFKQDKDGIPGKVASLEYDPNRSARIAWLFMPMASYVLAHTLVKTGQTVMSGRGAEYEAGNTMPLSNIPMGSLVYNVELTPGKGGQIARAAGNKCQLLAKEGRFVVLRLPSGEMRRVLSECRATIGTVGNEEHGNVVLGKAGRKRWIGRRPKVRGVVMNPVDHPMGGGEGRSSGGASGNAWGVPTKGYKNAEEKPLE